MSSPQPSAPHRAARIPLLGLIGLATSLFGLARFWNHRRNRRPTGTELMRMSEADFSSFIQDSGLKTVTSAGLSADGHAD
jgi:hypothetical protein